MREWTETRREGTDMGPVDWAHPDIATSGVPEERLRQIEAEPEQWLATNDGGWPRIGWKRVIALRMYDGWPYWTPKPALLVTGTLGAEWYFIGGRNVDVERRPTPAPEEREK